MYGIISWLVDIELKRHSYSIILISLFSEKHLLSKPRISNIIISDWRTFADELTAICDCVKENIDILCENLAWLLDDRVFVNFLSMIVNDKTAIFLTSSTFLWYIAFFMISIIRSRRFIDFVIAVNMTFSIDNAVDKSNSVKSSISLLNAGSLAFISRYLFCMKLEKHSIIGPLFFSQNNIFTMMCMISLVNSGRFFMISLRNAMEKLFSSVEDFVLRSKNASPKRPFKARSCFKQQVFCFKILNNGSVFKASIGSIVLAHPLIFRMSLCSSLNLNNCFMKANIVDWFWRKFPWTFDDEIFAIDTRMIDKKGDSTKLGAYCRFYWNFWEHKNDLFSIK